MQQKSPIGQFNNSNAKQKAYVDPIQAKTEVMQPNNCTKHAPKLNNFILSEAFQAMPNLTHN